MPEEYLQNLNQDWNSIIHEHGGFFNCVFFPVLVCLFVCHLIVGFLFLFLFNFFLSVLSTSPSLSSHPYSHPFHSPSFSSATIHCSPSQVLFLLLLIHSFSLPSHCPPIFLNLSTYYPSLLHTYHLLTNQLYITPTPCNPWHKNPTLQ
jgi:hypothetical protein